MRKVLIIAYYFPPLGMGGTQRAAKFAKYLPDFEWQPVVLTVKDIVYYAKDNSLLQDVEHASIIRAGSLDPQRLAHKLLSRFSPKKSLLTFGKNRRISKILSWLCIPDTKILWLPFAFFRARQIIRQEKIDCILTTSPPHSVHLLGLLLHKLTLIRWVADFRDGWSGGNFQDEPTALHRRLNRWLQNVVVRNADAVIAVSSGLLARLSSHKTATGKLHVITNGYDACDFKNMEASKADNYFTIVHCGALTAKPEWMAFLQAVALILKKQPALRKELRINLVGADLIGLALFVTESDLADVVHFTGYVSHADALLYLANADLLLYLLDQKASSDFIPGKTFEYIASRKPVISIGPKVEGVRILQQTTVIKHVPEAEPHKIARALMHCLKQNLSDEMPGLGDIEQYERRALTEKLTRILDSSKYSFVNSPVNITL